jgi:hypothetical protein
MPPMTLPARTDASLRAFAIVGATSLVILGAAASALRRRPYEVIGAATLASGIVTASARRPEALRRPYKAWNALAVRVSAVAASWLTRVAFETLMATRHVPDRPEMTLASASRSGWHERQSQTPETYRVPDMTPTTLDQPPLMRFANGSGREWFQPLVPLLRAMQWVVADQDETGSPPADTYTLY